ncbi:helix-loop-helix DNA-binding domain-containing protein [Entophlyctis helioformis]|nr:helix-loop-helix DNA-binding domain-containing protein [Entophlyctis helioformis]
MYANGLHHPSQAQSQPQPQFQQPLGRHPQASIGSSLHLPPFAQSKQPSLPALDPSMLSSFTQFPADMKDDEFIDSPVTGNFAMPSDFDMVNLASIARPGVGSSRSVVGNAASLQTDPQLMSPISASPLDHMDHNGAGAPGIHVAPNPFYSMSMPVHAAGFGPVDPTKFMGSHPSSYGSFGHPGSNGLLSASIDENGSGKGLTVDEKRRRRRESHNAVERRRRDHINEKIQELSNLLPEFAGDAQNKPNKGVVLRRSVDYIRHMQLFAAKQMERTMELERVLQKLIEERGIPEADLGLSMPLGTQIELPNIAANSSSQYDDGDD